jgi:hypothetical protein
MKRNGQPAVKEIKVKMPYCDSDKIAEFEIVMNSGRSKCLISSRVYEVAGEPASGLLKRFWQADDRA